MVADEVGHWLETADCRIVITLDLLAPAVSASLKKGQVEHLILTSLAPRMAMWRGMLYRIERAAPQWLSPAARGRTPAPLRPSAGAEPLERRLEVDPARGRGRARSHRRHHRLAQGRHADASQPDRQRPAAAELDRRRRTAPAAFLGVLPFFHSYGLTVSMLVSWARASTLHLHPRFESRAVLNCCWSASRSSCPRCRPCSTRSTTRCAAQGGFVLHSHGDLRGIGTGSAGAGGIREPWDRDRWWKGTV